MGGGHHDAFFKGVFSDTEVAAGMLAGLLPAQVAAVIDFGTLRLCPGEFVARVRGTRSTDLLFEARAADEPFLLHVNLEHQGRTDRWMPLRGLEYDVDVWKAWRKENPKARRLPPILSVVVYHGAHPWNAPTRLGELMHWSPALREALTGFVPDSEFMLVDLAAMHPTELRRAALPVAAQLALLALKQLRESKNVIATLLSWVDLLAAVAQARNGREVLDLLFYYVARVAPELTPLAVKTQLEPAVDARTKDGAAGGRPSEVRDRDSSSRNEGAGIPEGIPSPERRRNRVTSACPAKCRTLAEPSREAVVTLYDHLMEMGREKGLEEGEENALRKTLINLLTLKFGGVSEADHGRIAAASIAALEVWIPRVLTAESSATVFE